jgi:phage terminase Nu1 subunit (DNA packaging protein)
MTLYEQRGFARIYLARARRARLAGDRRRHVEELRLALAYGRNVLTYAQAARLHAAGHVFVIV